MQKRTVVKENDIKNKAKNACVYLKNGKCKIVCLSTRLFYGDGVTASPRPHLQHSSAEAGKPTVPTADLTHVSYRSI